MKAKIFLLVLFIFILTTSYGQFKVLSNGNVGIDTSDPECELQVGDEGTDRATLSVYNDGYGTTPRALWCKVEPSYPYGWAYGIISVVGNDGLTSGYIIGAQGNSYRGTATYTSQLTFGLYGLAGNGHNGHNYGVFARLEGDKNGAGLFALAPDKPYYPELDTIYAGYFSGRVKIEDELYVDETLYESDISLKKDIRNLEANNVAKLQQLRGIKYKLIHPTLLPTFEKPDTVSLESLQFDINYPKYTNDRIGLIAQDVQTVYPELVKVDGRGYLGLNYTGLIPVLVEAIKEQQNQIENLQFEIDNLKSSSSLKSESFNIINTEPPVNNSCTLYQNNPNPFNEKTVIKYYLPENNQNATIYIYDLQGLQKKAYTINEKGNTELIISGFELQPGMYMYTLVADGKNIDTKKMILTE